MQEAQIQEFKQIIWDYYKENRREFPWRETTDPYKIFISEVMLQQTQTYRVLPKYEVFIRNLPDFSTLAEAPFSKILNLWSGLGYNRRALYLQKAAQMIVKQFNNKLPSDPQLLITLPGIGAATAASISVFAFNTPLSFIETNIRRVFIHHFFPDQESVHDKDIVQLVEKTIDHDNPREWYYALMDYGAALPKQVKNPNTKSVHYVKQSRFEGSIRQVRGQILRVLLAHKKLTIEELKQLVKADERFKKAFNQLLAEEFILIKKGQVQLVS